MKDVRFFRSGLAIGTIGLALAGCSRGPGGEAARPGTIQPVGNAQLYNDVIMQLGSGRAPRAARTLRAMVRRNPADTRAQTLLASITADPVATLGTKSFEYTLKPGETMATVAEKFLGDRDKFYLLARYNGIAVADGIAAGRTIKVPGEAPKPAPRPEPKPRPTPPTPKPVPVKPKPTPSPSPSVPRNPALAVRLRAAGLAALNGGNVDRAVGLLRQADRLDPDNATIGRDLERAQRIRQTVKAKH